MWASIKTILKPDNFTVAYRARSDKKVFIGGGTYLIAEKNPNISTLIDLSGLIDTKITDRKGKVRIGAGATLQDLADVQQPQIPADLAAASRWSCPSKNIRNQRTLGGEIAKARTASEIVVLLHALGIELEIYRQEKAHASIHDWDGDGIISAIRFEAKTLTSSAIQRFAVIPSAPAFVIVAGVRRQETAMLAIGGQVGKIQRAAIAMKQFTDEWTRIFSEEAATQFPTDHLGSAAVKQKIIQTGLRRVREQI